MTVRAPFISGWARLLRCREYLGRFAEVLGGCGEEKFVICTVRAAQSKPSKTEDAFKLGEEHLDLLSEPHRDCVLFSLRNVACDLTGVFVFFAGDGSEVGIGAAFGFGWAGLARQFQGAVFRDAFAVRASAGVRIVAAELLE